jgi:hypothetical protein
VRAPRRRHEPALRRAEAQQLRLRSLPAAAGAGPGSDVCHAVPSASAVSVDRVV